MITEIHKIKITDQRRTPCDKDGRDDVFQWDLFLVQCLIQLLIVFVKIKYIFLYGISKGWWVIHATLQQRGSAFCPEAHCNRRLPFCNFYLLIQMSLKSIPKDLTYNRKYKDYVYRKMLVQEYLKKWRIFKRVKPKNDMMYHDIYNCICQNTKK